MKLLLEAMGLTKSFGLQRILDIDVLHIYDGQRIGLIGENGAGKTTLLRLLAGEIPPDSGTINRLAPISVIRQQGHEAAPIADAHMAALFSVQADSATLSGGELTRRRIAAALTRRGQLLLADEPTSDLDAAGIDALKAQLTGYAGTMVIVSHDRGLLRDVCTSICELEDGRIRLFPGGYDAYLQQKAREKAHQADEYSAYRAEKSRLTQLIQAEVELASQKQHLPSRMGNSEARLHKRATTVAQKQIHKVRHGFESRLARLEDKPRPREDPDIRIAFGTHTPIPGRNAMEIRGMSIRFGSRILLENAAMTLPAGAKCALIGPNGVGKTTLLRRIAAGNDPRIRIHPAAKIGIFGQDHAETLVMNQTALENALRESIYDESTARTVLARLNMRADNVFKRVEVLSGGERTKTAIARLLLSDINLLLLDEPTNHLDVYTLEALENVLCQYGGTLLMVSHDAEFVRAIADRLVFFQDGTLTEFAGSMEAWQEKQNRNSSAERNAVDLSILEMRLAVLAARLAQPQKGDSPDALNQQYLALADEIRKKRS